MDVRLNIYTHTPGLIAYPGRATYDTYFRMNKALQSSINDRAMLLCYLRDDMLKNVQHALHIWDQMLTDMDSIQDLLYSLEQELQEAEIGTD
jgi:hypothetical protein